ncbi:MAG TPA: hypothetical protein PKX92_03380 [Edaphocola sp.]|nr:hypothetical protein [Edaphocola sp.]
MNLFFLKMKAAYFFFGLLLLTSFSIQAQPLSAFVNFQNQFQVWDNTIERKIESLVPVKYDIGRIAIPYIDNNSNFKIYYKGGVQQLNEGFTNDFVPTDNLVAYRNQNILHVWEQGKVTKLSNYVTNYAVGDSLVLFYDNIYSTYKAYYQGNVFDIETFLAARNISNSNGKAIFDGQSIASGQLPVLKVSDNIAAFINYAERFKIFYHGQLLEQEQYLVANFDVGRNTVAYVDANQAFKIFHEGKTEEIEALSPSSYKTGDDIVAYVSNDGYFKIYYQGEALEVGYFTPDEYLVADNIVAFKDAGGYFKVFYKGKIYTLDAFYPNNSYKLSYNSLAYVSNNGMIRMFSDGNVYDVTNASVSEWRLDYDVLQYRFGSNMYKVFYKGKTY